jgi:hypothetical protein
MPAVALDAERLAQLRVFNEAELRQITADVIDAVGAQFDRLQTAFAGHDLTTAADAAHRARNEALLVGAMELCDAFTEVEEASRSGDGRRASDAARAAQDLWPPTRDAIASVFAPERQVPAEGAL